MVLRLELHDSTLLLQQPTTLLEVFGSYLIRDRSDAERQLADEDRLTWDFAYLLSEKSVEAVWVPAGGTLWCLACSPSLESRGIITPIYGSTALVVDEWGVVADDVTTATKWAEAQLAKPNRVMAALCKGGSLYGAWQQIDGAVQLVSFRGPSVR